MSFLKNILGAFVELKEDDPAVKRQGSTADTSTNKPENATATSASKHTSLHAQDSTPSQSSSASAAEFNHHFEELINDANAKNPLFSGTDFKEFIDSKSDVEAIADEPTKYRTAFNVLKRTGLTKQKLLTTGEEYIKIIEQDLNAFENAFNQQYKADVEHKEQALQQKAQELQVLSERLSALNDEIKKMSQEIVQSKDKLNVNRNAFVLAGEAKKKEIRTELKKIEEYFL